MTEIKKTNIHITWPDLTFPPINLYVLVPAWFFYASEEERQQYFDNRLNFKEEK